MVRFENIAWRALCLLLVLLLSRARLEETKNHGDKEVNAWLLLYEVRAVLVVSNECYTSSTAATKNMHRTDHLQIMIYLSIYLR